MKKLCTILLIAVILTACGGNDGAPAPTGKVPENIFVGHTSYSIHEDGAFYGDIYTGTLRFVDFNSLNSVPVCPKPNCQHTDENACSALGLILPSAPIYYNNKLYYFIGQTGWTPNIQTTPFKIMSADTDGSNRRLLYETTGIIPNISMRYYVIADDVLYFTGKGDDTEEVSPGNFVSGSGKNMFYLFSFCLRTHEFNEIAVLAEGYHGFAEINGVFNNEIYIIVSYNDKQYDFGDPEAYNTAIRKNKIYSFRTGEVSENNLFYWSMISQDYYVYPRDYPEDNRLYARTKTGEEFLLGGLTEYGIIIEEKFISFYGGEGWDFAKSELFLINDEFQGVLGDEVLYAFVAIHEGDYILERTTTVFSEPNENGDRGIVERKFDFIRVTEAELIKG